MDITELLSALQARAPWASARRVITMSGLDPSQGWDKTIARYEDVDVDDEEHDTLSDYLVQHILAGEKSLQFYKTSKQEFASAADALAKIKVNKDIVAAFPAISNLASFDGISKSPQPILQISGDDGSFVVFGSVRDYEERVPVDLSLLSTQAQKVLAEYSQVIGVRKVQHQAYDVVWLPKKGTTIVVACDAPKGAPADFPEIGHSSLRAILRKTVKNSDLSPINLFPAIEKIYRSDWGKVVELTFTTDTGSVKHERMRLQKLCLRQELFHMGGKEAVEDVLHPFHISVDWLSRDGMEIAWRPELTLHSGVRELNAVPSKLYSALFRHGLTARDLKILRSHLLKYV